MKAMFYGGAVAAIGGLLMGAGLKTPTDAFDMRAAADEMAYIQNADFGDPEPAAASPASLAYQPDYVSGVAYAPSGDPSTGASAAEAEPYVAPAVYAADEPEDTTAATSLAALDEAAAPPPVRIIASDVPAEPQPLTQEQGFSMVGRAGDPS